MFVRKDNNNGNHVPPRQNQTPQQPDHSSTTTHLNTTAFRMDELAMLCGRCALALGMIYVTTEYVADITLCEGPSMSPTIRPKGEIILIDKRAVLFLGLQGGSSEGEKRAQKARLLQQEYEKKHANDTWYEPRISVSDLESSWASLWQLLTTPISVGDVVVLKHPTRNGTVCKRILGLPGDQVLDSRLSIVPDGHLWVEGDNPANSSDSRNYGPVPASLLVGRALMRVWPLRGNALLLRGSRPVQPEYVAARGSVVLPAGYDGQHIQKTKADH